MRTIERSSAFKRDYKREAKGQHRATLDANLIPVLMALANDKPLEQRHRDHDLSGEWAGYRDSYGQNINPSQSSDANGHVTGSTGLGVWLFLLSTGFGMVAWRGFVRAAAGYGKTGFGRRSPCIGVKSPHKLLL